MNKTLSVITCLFLSSSTFAAGNFSCSPFNGLFGGVSLGYGSLTVEDNRSVSLSVTGIFDISITDQSRASDYDATFGLDAGYGQVFRDRFYLGIVGRATLDNSHSANFNTTMMETSATLNINENTRVKLQNVYSALLKFGITSGENTLFYGVIGPQWGNFTTVTNASYGQDIGIPFSSTTSRSHSGYENAFLLGVGIEHFVTRHFSAAIEYTYADYGNLRSSNPPVTPILIGGVLPIPDSRLSDSNKINAKVNSGFVKVNYYLA